MSETKPDYEVNTLKQYENWAVILDGDQTYLGRSRVSLNRAMGIGLEVAVTIKEFDELDMIFRGVANAVNRLYQPDEFSYADNQQKQYTWQIIPRYATPRIVLGHAFIDPNYPKKFAPYSRAEVPEEVIEQIKTDMKLELNRE